MSELNPPSARQRLGRAALLRASTIGLCLLALFAACAPAMAVDPEDLLPVDEAFALTARAQADDGIALRWKIADGYYLYKQRISVTADAGFTADALQLPGGEPHEDEFFGRVETYRGDLRATLPGQANKARTVLTVKYQGCADLGICYPPQTRDISVVLPKSPGRMATAGAPVNEPFATLGARSGAGNSNPLFGARPGIAGTDSLPLPPEQAFGFEAIAEDGNTLLLRFTPAPGYYLYRDKTTLKLAGADTSLGKPRWPRGQAHRDEHFGDVVVYFDQVEVPVPLVRPQSGPLTLNLTAGFQGCQTDGICYPPMTRTLEVAVPAGTIAPETVQAAAPDSRPSTATSTDKDVTPDPSADSASVAGNGGRGNRASASPGAGATPSMPGNPATGTDDAPNQAEDSLLAAALSGPDRWLALLSFFGFGLLLAFTPCVLPMVPILSGLIVGASAGHKRGLGTGRALLLSLVYVFASALVFTVAGVVAGLVGANLQIAFQNPWVLAAFAAVFVALALSSFGLYELQLPSALRNRLGALSDQQHGGSLPGVAVMGALSALIVGPCVAPPLAAAVLYIGQTQDPVFGGAALFLLAMGMGMPLLAFGVAAGKGLPTSGPWMVAVQRAFGIVFLGLAVWMLSRVLPGPATLGLWGALLLGATAMLAVAMRGTTFGSGLRAMGWTVAALLGLAGASQIVGALAGSHDPLQPLAGLRAGGQRPAELPFRRIKSLADLDREVAAARAAGKPLMLDFYADWCVSCKEMEKYTFPAAPVQAALAGFVLLKADVTANDTTDQALMKRLGIIGPPATLYFVDGTERRDLRLFGFEEAGAFVQRAGRVYPVDEGRPK